MRNLRNFKVGLEMLRGLPWEIWAAAGIIAATAVICWLIYTHTRK